MYAKACVLIALVAAVFAQQTFPPPDECHICEHIVAQARHHFNNNVNNKAALQKELLQECHHLPPNEPTSATQTCIDMVNKNIDKIFSDIQAGDRDGQTCYDIGACVSVPTFQTHPPRPTRANRK